MINEENDYFDPDSEEELALAMSRTIEEVFDKKEGVFIQSSDFFRKPEGELVLWRRSLEESILIGKPRLVCSHCDQMVKLLGRRTERGKIAFFAHLHDSDECDIKTTGVPMTKEEILAKKYGKIQESERHIRLKNFIAEILSTPKSIEIGFNNVEIEKRVKSNLPYLNWRKPDVMADYNGKKLVFELQLSTTFLGVVVDRDIFYRLNNFFIIWVFNFDDNQEYVNLENLMCKDIYYANKRNVFIFDRDAQNKSIEQGKLYLKCRWIGKNNMFNDGKLVAIDELSFDEEQCKPYYVDADEIYYESHPSSRIQVQKLEHSRLEIVEGLMARMNKKYEDQIKWEKERQEAIKSMKENGAKAVPFCKDGLYGYKYENTILVHPYYKNAGEIQEDGYGRVNKSRKNGLVDCYGMSVLPCLYKEILPIGDGHFIVQLANQWKLFGREEPIRKVSTCDAWYFKRLNEHLSVASLKYETRAKAGPDTSKEVDILVYDDGVCKFFKSIQKTKDSNRFCAHISSSYGYDGFRKYEECEIDANGITYLKKSGSFHIVISKADKYGLVDSNYELVLEPQYKLLIWVKANIYIATDNNETNGVITHNNVSIIPFEYTAINNDSVDNSYWIVNKSDKYGVVNDDHETILPIIYDSIKSISSGVWIVNKDTKYGVVEKGNVLIPIIFDSVERICECISGRVDFDCLQSEAKSIFERFWLVSINNLLGIYDIDFKQALPCICKDIEMLDEQCVLITLKNNKKGIMNLYEEDFLIQAEYDDICVGEDKSIICKTKESVSLFSNEGKLIFSHFGKELSNIISGMYIFVKEYERWNLYNIESKALVYRNCFSDKIIVNEDGTINLTKCTDADKYTVRIDKDGTEIPIQNHIESTIYTISSLKRYIKITDDKGHTILPYGDYTHEIIDGELMIKSELNKYSVKDIHHSDIDNLADGLNVTSVCGNYGVFIEDWKEPIIPYAFSNIELSKDLVLVTKNEKKGIYSSKGEVVLYPIYSDIRILSNGFFVCKLEKRRFNYRYGSWTSSETMCCIKNSQGLDLLSNYPKIEIPGDYEDGKLSIIHDNQSSYLDINGNLILEDIHYIDSDRFIYKLFGKYGLRTINETIWEPMYKSIQLCEDGILITNDGRKCTMFNSYLDKIIEDSVIRYLCKGRYEVRDFYLCRVCDSTGKEIKESFKGSIKVFQNGYILIKKESGKCRYTFVNSDMEPVYCLEDSVRISGEEFENGKIEIRNNQGTAFLTDKFEILPSKEEQFFESYIKFQVLGRWGLKLGEKIIHEAEYEEIELIPSVGYILKSFYSSLYDLDSNIIISDKKRYNKIQYIKHSGGLFFVMNYSGVGLCDINGKEIISPTYEGMSICKGYVKVKKEKDVSKSWRSHYVELYGLFSLQGKMILSCQYTDISFINDNIVHGVGHRLNDFVKVDGTLIKAEKIEIHKDGYLISEYNSKFGLLDETGSEIAPPIYDEIINPSIHVYKGRKGRTWFDVIENKKLYVDELGIPLINGLFSSKEKGKFGVVDSNGETIYPFVFDKISLGGNNKIIGTIGDQSIDVTKINYSPTPQNGDICVGEVTNVVVYGLFVNVGNLSTGLLHKSKLKGVSPNTFFEGDSVIVKILSIRDDGKVDYELF